MDNIVLYFLIHRYNHKTYKIDDIAWDKTPLSTFSKRDGKEISLIDYYQEVKCRSFDTKSIDQFSSVALST